jgi:hypothetical protein
MMRIELTSAPLGITHALFLHLEYSPQQFSSTVQYPGLFTQPLIAGGWMHIANQPVPPSTHFSPGAHSPKFVFFLDQHCSYKPTSPEPFGISTTMVGSVMHWLYHLVLFSHFRPSAQEVGSVVHVPHSPTGGARVGSAAESTAHAKRIERTAKEGRNDEGGKEERMMRE